MEERNSKKERQSSGSINEQIIREINSKLPEKFKLIDCEENDYNDMSVCFTMTVREWEALEEGIGFLTSSYLYSNEEYDDDFYTKSSKFGLCQNFRTAILITMSVLLCSNIEEMKINTCKPTHDFMKVFCKVGENLYFCNN